MSMKKIFLTGCLFVLTLISQNAHAVLGLNETGEILPNNYYKVGVAPEAILSSGGGFNVSVFADMHLFDSADGRITFGSGKTDFWAMATLKWVPFPDVDRQPAIGLRGGIGYIRDEDTNFTTLQISPIISKKADTQYGHMIPYVGLPVTFITTKDDSYVASQFAVGAEWQLRQDRAVGFELDLNMNKSTSSFAVFLSFPFESSTGYLRD